MRRVITQEISDKIIEGFQKAGGYQPSIVKYLAETAGVSISTVARVLKKNGLWPDEATIQRVLNKRGRPAKHRRSLKRSLLRPPGQKSFNDTQRSLIKALFEKRMAQGDKTENQIFDEISVLARCSSSTIRHLIKRAPRKAKPQKKERKVVSVVSLEEANKLLRTENDYLRWFRQGALYTVNGKSWIDRLIEEVKEL